MNLYIDIETIPDIRFKDDIEISPPGNMSKPETIEQWEKGEGKYAGQKEAEIEKEFRKFALNGTFGKILCIGWAFNDSLVKCPLGDEDAILTEFLTDVHDLIYAIPGKPETIKWIGHYITGFDLRFIWQRCVINKIKPPIRIPYDAKPWSDNVFDTCIQWKGSGSSSGSLNALCKAFGIEGKDMDGSQVYDEFLKGNYDKISDYCKDEVEKVRKLHKRMAFI